MLKERFSDVTCIFLVVSAHTLDGMKEDQEALCHVVSLVQALTDCHRVLTKQFMRSACKFSVVAKATSSKQIEDEEPQHSR